MKHSYLIHKFLCLLSIFYLQGCQVIGTYRYKHGKSKNFNGTKFVNQDPITDHGFSNFLKWRMNSQKKKWPKWIENKQFEEPPVRVNDDNVSYTFVNHATILIQTRGQNILTDPIFSERSSPVSFAGPKRVRAPGITLEKLPPIDTVLISHNHYDHLDIPSLRALQTKDDPQILVGLGVDDLLKQEGFTKVTSLDWWEQKKIQGIEYTFTPCRHFSGRGLLDRMQTLWGSFLIKTPDRRIYFAGDTGYGRHFRKISDRFGAIDLAFIPIGAYEPRWFMKDVHLNPAEAVRAHVDLQSKHSVGIHFGTFDDLTDEGINEPIEGLNQQLDQVGLDRDTFIAPEFGKTYKL